MTIDTPATIQISSESDLWVPAMAQDPLKKALQNANYLMKWHRPPLASVAYTGTAEDTTSAVYVFPVLPSIDGLLYSAVHRFVCSAATQAVTIEIDETSNYAGGATTWNGLTSDTATSAAAGALSTHTQADFVVAATTEALRITYTAPPVGNRTDHHIVIHPSPGAPVVGIMPSGAVPFDDGLMADGDGSPIHTEFLNRCKRTAVAVLQSRKQNCLSFCQEESAYRYLWDAKAASKHYPLPPCRVWLPNQGPTVTIDVLAIATVDGGTTTDLVRVRQLGVPSSLSVFLDASGGVEAAELKLKLKKEGGSALMTYADLEIAVSRAAGQETRFLSCMGYYTPGVD